MKKEELIRKNKALFWFVDNPEEISPELLTETILNLGDWSDVQELISVLGAKEVARLFFARAEQERNNYRPEIKNYFELYFKKYA